jgi:hypothetical protein
VWNDEIAYKTVIFLHPVALCNLAWGL